MSCNLENTHQTFTTEDDMKQNRNENSSSNQLDLFGNNTNSMQLNALVPNSITVREDRHYPLLREILKSPYSNLNSLSPGFFYEKSENLLSSNFFSESPLSTPISGNYSKPQKKSQRKNPWGTKTYSDLIAIAINSQPDKQATLQQIYDYIIENFDYFRLKNDSTSSVGWKNSIRHNLSLHQKFIKCPRQENNQRKKSSFWRVNQNSKEKNNQNEEKTLNKNTNLKQLFYSLEKYSTNKEIEQQNDSKNTLFNVCDAPVETSKCFNHNNKPRDLRFQRTSGYEISESPLNRSCHSYLDAFQIATDTSMCWTPSSSGSTQMSNMEFSSYFNIGYFYPNQNYYWSLGTNQSEQSQYNPYHHRYIKQMYPYNPTNFNSTSNSYNHTINFISSYGEFYSNNQHDIETTYFQDNFNNKFEKDNPESLSFQ